MSRTLLASVLALLVCGAIAESTEPVIGCYYRSWSIHVPDDGQYGVNDLPSQCTHIMYTFYTMTTDGDIIAPDDATYTDSDTGKSSSVDDFTSLKENRPGVELLASVGGWTGSTNFSAVVNNDIARANFVQNAVALLKSQGFDGLDIAWDYPGLRNGVSTDKEEFVNLLSELREAFGNNYTLTVAVAVTQTYIDAGYNVTEMASFVDYFFVQAYEYHGTWDKVTGANAPKFPQTTDSETTNLNVNYSINVWLSNGAPAEKVVLGVASFGKSFTLEDSTQTDTGSAVTGAGTAGYYTQEAGVLAYYEICEALQNDTSSWTVVDVTDNYVYAYKDTQWIGYDNEETVLSKSQLARDYGLAGIFMWSIDQDDFSGKCGDQYPLLQSALSAFN